MSDQLKKWGKWGLALAIFAYLGKLVFDQWDVLRGHSWEVKPPLIALAFALGILPLMSFVRIWQGLLRGLGAEISYPAVFRIWYAAALFRYLPGKVAGVAAMIYLCEKKGVSKLTCLGSGVLNQVFSILSALTVGAAFVLHNPADGLGARTLLLAGSAVVASLLAFPVILERVINPLCRRRGWPAIAWKMDFKSCLYFYGFYVLAWVTWGCGFYAVVRSLTDLPLAYLPQMVSIFTITYLAGFLAVFTPNGLGVREGLLTTLLIPYVPTPVAVVISLFSRMWLIVSEMACIAIAYRIKE